MSVRDFPPRPQGAQPDSVPYQNWLDALGQRQNIDLLQELTSVASGDEVAIFDVSETGQNKTKKVTVANLLAGAGGGVTWQSVQTSDFNAASNNAYPIDTSSSAITVTLPASPVVGDLLVFVDYAGTWDADSVTVNPNGNNFLGNASNKTLDQQREGITLVYVDSTQGWIPYSGFNEITPTSQFNVDLVVVAGGGGGGGTRADSRGSGGGGAGGYREFTSLPVNLLTNYTVTVGAGGNGGSGVGVSGSQGSASVFGSITSAGGGGGGANSAVGLSGGSGGGGSSDNLSGGSGNTPSTSPSQGNNGGNGGIESGGVLPAGGGGGASAVGAQGSTSGGSGGNGGAGTASSITGSSVTRAGGGGGGNYGNTAGTGGAGGGGNGGSNANGSNGTANTGGGGGGSGGVSGGSTTNRPGGNGGSGVVIIKYPDTVTISNPGGGLTYSTATSGGFSVTTFTAGTGNVSWS